MTISEILRDDWPYYEPMKEFCPLAIPDILRAADTIDTLVAALEGAERKMVNLYRGINPHANDSEGGPGNRFADKDEDVVAARAALALARE